MSRKRNRTQQNVSPMVAKDSTEQLIRNMCAMDAYANPAAGLGWGAENLSESTTYPLTRLTQNYMLMLSLYRSSGILKRIINKPVEDSVSHWIKIDSQITPQQMDSMERLERRANIKAKIAEGLRWGYLFGGAAGLIVIDGQGDQLDQPLDLNTVEPDSFKGIHIVDRWSGVYPSPELVDDIADPDFGLPDYYEIREDEQSDASLTVHHSRVLRFTGDELPYWEKQLEQEWGTSKVETIFDSLKRYDNVLGNIANLVWQANIWTQKTDKMEQLLGLAPNSMQQNFVNSIHAQQRLMSSFGTRFVDKEDDLQNHQYGFSGLDKVFEIFQYDMSSVSGIPITILFGRSAAGLDSTGDADMDNYYTMLESIQENKIRPVIEQLLPVMCMSEFGAVPDDINISFKSVRSQTEKEKSEIASSKTSAINSAFTAGLISQQVGLKELRSMSDSTGMYSNITDEDIENADDVPDVGDISQGGSQPGMSDEEYEKRYGHLRDSIDEEPDISQTQNGIDSASDKPSIEEIQTAAEKYKPDYKMVAVRTQETPFELGKIKHRSERWSDGEPTGEKLDGLSVTSVRSSAVRKHTPEFDPREGQYQGKYVALIGGNRYHTGHDKGEVVIRDPVVLEILRPKGESENE